MYNEIMIKQTLAIAKPEHRMPSNWQVTQYGCDSAISSGGLM